MVTANDSAIHIDVVIDIEIRIGIDAVIVHGHRHCDCVWTLPQSSTLTFAMGIDALRRTYTTDIIAQHRTPAMDDITIRTGLCNYYYAYDYAI